MYPGDGGYGYAENSVVASFINYVPIQKALQDLRLTAFKTMSIGIGSVLVILMSVWVFINRVIARPVILTNGPRDGRYRVLLDPRRWRHGLISRANVADFLVKQVKTDEHLGRTPVLLSCPL